MEAVADYMEGRKLCRLLLDSKRAAHLIQRTKSYEQGELLTKVIQFRSGNSEENESVIVYKRQVVGPTWRGSVDISEPYSRSLHGLKAFVPKTDGAKHLKITRLMPPLLNFRMYRKLDTKWRRNLEKRVVDYCDIGLYIFPDSSWSVKGYDSLVEYMISNNLAMASDIGREDLVVFPSIDYLPSEQWTIKGKHYLWGMFERKDSRKNQIRKHKKSHSEKIRFPVTSASEIGIHLEKIRFPVTSASAIGPQCGRKRKRKSLKVVSVTTSAYKPKFLKKLRNERTESTINSKSSTKSQESNSSGAIILQQRHDGQSGDQINSNVGPSSKYGECIDKATREKVPQVTIEEHNGVVNEMSKDQDGQSSFMEFPRSIENCTVLLASVSGEITLHHVRDPSGICFCKFFSHGHASIPSTSSHGASEKATTSVQDDTLEITKEVHANEAPLSLGINQLAAKRDVMRIHTHKTVISGSRAVAKASDMTIHEPILKMACGYQESNSDDVLIQVGRYIIKSDLAPLLEKIIEKHGDIARNCKVPDVGLVDICKAVQDLQSVQLKEMTPHHVRRCRKELKRAEALKVDVEWLRERCDELEKLVPQINRYPCLKAEIDRCNKILQEREELLNSKCHKLDQLQGESESLLGKLMLKKEQEEELDCTLQHLRSAHQRYSRSLLDGLL